MEPSRPHGPAHGPARDLHRAVAETAVPKEEGEAAVPAVCREPASPCGPGGRVRERVGALREAGADMLDVIPIGVRDRAGRPRPSRADSRRGPA
ncbi:hypothetical protein [Streptomyces fagopyri]|uniref:hypothetical protein n=1 Tax=Streptomyces fagopyri TaxID=2662397 RepID=UPI0033FD8EE5